MSPRVVRSYPWYKCRVPLEGPLLACHNCRHMHIHHKLKDCASSCVVRIHIRSVCMRVSGRTVCDL